MSRTDRLMISSMLILGASPVLAGSWQGQEVVENGVVHIKNPSEPMEETTLRPERLWQIGGDSDEDVEIFGRVENILLDDTGEVYVLDSQLSEVRVFSPDGDYLRTVGREGEGPGEFRNAVMQFFLPEDRIGIVQLMPSRIAVVGRHGDGFSDFSLPFESSRMALVQEMRSRGDRVVLSRTSPAMTESGVVITRTLLALDADGAQPTTIEEHAEQQPPGPIRIGADIDEDFFRNWQLGPDGRVYVAPYYGRYAVHVLDPAGEPRRVVEREYESLPRSRDEMDEIRAQRKRMEDQYGVSPDEGDINPNLRDVNRIVARDNGETWVLSSRGQADCPDGALGMFDVFDPDGRFVRQVTIEVDYDDRYDDFAIVGNRLFILEEANSASDQVSSSSSAGSQMTMIRRGGGQPAEDDREAEPFAIVCYELSL